MTSQDIIQKILACNPEVTEGQVQERLRAERARSGGLLGDETLLRLIAAKFGVAWSRTAYATAESWRLAVFAGSTT